MGSDGKLITESLKDYTRQTIRKDYSSLDKFLLRWNNAERKAVILLELEAPTSAERASNLFPGFDSEIQGLYREADAFGAIRFMTYVVRE